MHMPVQRHMNIPFAGEPKPACCTASIFRPVPVCPRCRLDVLQVSSLRRFLDSEGLHLRPVLCSMIGLLTTRSKKVASLLL